MEIISNDELVMVSGGRPDEVVAAIAAGAPLDDAGLAAWMAGAAVGGVVAVAHGQRGGLCRCLVVAFLCYPQWGRFHMPTMTHTVH